MESRGTSDGYEEHRVRGLLANSDKTMNIESSSSEASFQTLSMNLKTPQDDTANVEDLRKTQIRESNREAARRCRERRRKHIENLEVLTKQYEQDIDNLKEQNKRLRREIVQLRTIVLRNFASNNTPTTDPNQPNLATVVVLENGEQSVLPVGMSIPLDDDHSPSDQ